MNDADSITRQDEDLPPLHSLAWRPEVIVVRINQPLPPCPGKEKWLRENMRIVAST